FYFFFSSRRRHTRFSRDWSSDVCSSDLRRLVRFLFDRSFSIQFTACGRAKSEVLSTNRAHGFTALPQHDCPDSNRRTDLHLFCLDRKSTRLNSSHVKISYAVFCLKKKKI